MLVGGAQVALRRRRCNRSWMKSAVNRELLQTTAFIRALSPFLKGRPRLAADAEATLEMLSRSIFAPSFSPGSASWVAPVAPLHGAARSRGLKPSRGGPKPSHRECPQTGLERIGGTQRAPDVNLGVNPAETDRRRPSTAPRLLSGGFPKLPALGVVHDCHIARHRGQSRSETSLTPPQQLASALRTSAI